MNRNCRRHRNCLWILLSLLVTGNAAFGVTRYVNVNNTKPVSPYTTWSKAATNIQTAIDIAAKGDVILVTNGTYSVGKKVVPGVPGTNVVAVTKAITVRSVNGPSVTHIYGVPVSWWRVRCVYLTNDAVLSGFTVLNGSASVGSGVYCASTSSLITNCVVSGNWSDSQAAGIYSGTANDCVISGNSVINVDGYLIGTGGGAVGSTLIDCRLDNNRAGAGGGVHSCILSNCTVVVNSTPDQGEGGGAHTSSLTQCALSDNRAGAGGGAYQCAITNCLVLSNQASAGAGVYNSTVAGSTIANGANCYEGGGAWGGTLYNCLLTNNSVFESGGGAYLAVLNNCWASGNHADWGGGVSSCTASNSTITGNSGRSSGGARASTLYNSIIFNNSGYEEMANYEGGSLNYCVTLPLPSNGIGNLTGDPQLTGQRYLTPWSICRGVGNPAYARGVDLDGEPWLNPPSIGCDEFRPESVSGPLTIRIVPHETNGLSGVELTLAAEIAGQIAACRWEFGDGTVISNKLSVAHTWWIPGNYTVTFRAYNNSNPDGKTATIAVIVEEQGQHQFQLWLQQFGLDANGTADNADSDGDKMSNRQEWIAGTCPTNAASLLKLLSPVASHAASVPVVTLQWLSVTNRTYSVERLSDAAGSPVFSVLRSNIAGMAGITSFTVTNLSGPGPFLYRIRIEP